MDTTGPAAPVLNLPAAAAILRGTTTFSWSAPATGYEFEYDDDSGFGSPAVDHSTLTGTNVVVTSPERGSYYWRVRAKDALGNWGPWSAARTFTVNALTPPVTDWSPSQATGLPRTRSAIAGRV